MKNLITLSIFLCFGFYSFAQSPIFGKWYLSRVLPNGEGYCFVRNQTASKYFFELPKDSAAKIILNLPNDSIIGLADRFSLIDTAAYLKDYQSNFSFNDTRSLRKLSIVFYDNKFRYCFMDYLFNDSLIITKIIKDKNSIIEDYKLWKYAKIDCPKIRKQEQEKLELHKMEFEKLIAEETKRIKKIYPDSIIPELVAEDSYFTDCDDEYKRKEPIFFLFRYPKCWNTWGRRNSQ